MSPSDEIRRTFEIFVKSGLTEVRIISGPQRTISGYFDDPEKLIAALQSLYRGDRRDELRRAQVYFLLNSPNPALLARAANRFEPKPKSTTADHDIVHRDWLPIDLDPVRTTDVSSTDEEHAAALERAAEIRPFLSEPRISGAGERGQRQRRAPQLSNRAGQ